MGLLYRQPIRGKEGDSETGIVPKRYDVIDLHKVPGCTKGRNKNGRTYGGLEKKNG